MFGKAIKGAAFGAVMIGSVAAVASSDEDAGPGQASYVPMQGISHDLGSKSAIGYFIREAGACQVVLMIAEKVDPETAAMPSAARLRLVLLPGQAAGLDSEEGRTVDLTCGENAATLDVRSGATKEIAVLTN